MKLINIYVKGSEFSAALHLNAEKDFIGKCNLENLKFRGGLLFNKCLFIDCAMTRCRDIATLPEQEANYILNAYPRIDSCSLRKCDITDGVFIQPAINEVKVE